MIDPAPPQIEIVDRVRSVIFVAGMFGATFAFIVFARREWDADLDRIDEDHLHYLIHLLQFLLFAIVAFRCSSLSGITGY